MRAISYGFCRADSGTLLVRPVVRAVRTSVNSANVPLQNEAGTAAGAGNSRTGNHLTHVKDNFDRSRELIRNQRENLS